jgi:arylsulfatase A-like enzyme
MARWVTRSLILALFGTLGAFAAYWATEETRRINVVLVVIDTLRRDHLAAYGYARETTPVLSAIAREGTRFDALSPSSWTKPATASLLTGLHPLRHQTFGRVDRLPDSAVTLAERLSAFGYDTLGLSANGWVARAFGFAQGFRRFVEEPVERAHAVDLVRQVQPDIARLREPFFLYAHFVDPHLPYDPSTDWRGEPLVGSRPVELAEVDATHSGARPAALLRRARDLYDGEVRGADSGLGMIIESLRRRGVLERTLVVVTADHGEELQEHGRMSHGQTLYSEVLDVPLVLSGPGVPRGRHFGGASLLDVVPTVLALVHRPLADTADLDGRSLLPALHRRASPERSFLAHLDFIDGRALALQQGSQKIVLMQQPFAKQVFDLANDPAEQRNLFGTPQGARVVTTLGSHLAALYNRYLETSLAPAVAETDLELRKVLAAVGYAGSSVASVKRRLPRRIAPPDLSPRGSLGWGDGESSCTVPEGVAAAELLDGWYGPEPGGRWSGPSATLRLARPRPGEAARLQVRGVSYRPASVELRIRGDGRLLRRTTIAVGAFEIDADVPVAAERAALIELETADAFVPAQHGAADQRALGLFFTSICLH